MASNVTTAIVNGKLVITCELDKVAKRTSKDTGDVLAAIDFEKLSALCPSVTGVTGEIKVSLGVYFMDKARNAATQAPAPVQKPLTELSREELLALLAKTQATTPVQAPAPKKERSDAQKANDAKLAAAGKARLEAMRAGKVTK